MSMRILTMLLTAALVVLVGAGVLWWLVPAGRPGDASAATTMVEAPIPEAVAPADLDKLMSGHHGPVLLDFHADWCEPCKALHPILGRLAAGRPDLLVVGVDVVKAEALAQHYGVGDLPLLVLLNDGGECARHVGAPDLATLRAWVILHLAAKAASATDAEAAPGAGAAQPEAASAAASATAASP
jgi:thioredoxin 1